MVYISTVLLVMSSIFGLIGFSGLMDEQLTYEVELAQFLFFTTLAVSISTFLYVKLKGQKTDFSSCETDESPHQHKQTFKKQGNSNV